MHRVNHCCPAANSVSGKGGKNVTDGPYTEGKELVGGYFIVNANNYDEAVAIAQRLSHIWSGWNRAGTPGAENGYVKSRQPGVWSHESIVNMS